MSLKGKVFSFKEFKFQDGSTGKKLLVFLNDGSVDKNFIILKTTSKSSYYEKIGVKGIGCFSKKNVFVYNGKPFNKITYIEFNPDAIFMYTFSQIAKASIDGFLKSEPIGIIPENILKGIINCFKKSDDYVEGLYNKLLD